MPKPTRPLTRDDDDTHDSDHRTIAEMLRNNYSPWTIMRAKIDHMCTYHGLSRVDPRFSQEDPDWLAADSRFYKDHAFKDPDQLDELHHKQAKAGDCYKDAGKFILDNPAFHDQVKLVHGTVTSNKSLGDFGHAWVELGDLCIDNASGAVMHKGDYYQKGGIKDTVTYSPDEAMRHMAETEHYGPWHETNARHSSKTDSACVNCGKEVMLSVMSQPFHWDTGLINCYPGRDFVDPRGRPKAERKEASHWDRGDSHWDTHDPRGVQERTCARCGKPVLKYGSPDGNVWLHVLVGACDDPAPGVNKLAQVTRTCVKCGNDFDQSEAGQYTGFCGTCREKEGLVDHAWDSKALLDGHYGAQSGDTEGVIRFSAKPGPGGEYRLYGMHGGGRIEPGVNAAQCAGHYGASAPPPGHHFFVRPPATEPGGSADPRGPALDPKCGECGRSNTESRHPVSKRIKVKHQAPACGCGFTDQRQNGYDNKEGIKARVALSGGDASSAIPYAKMEPKALIWPTCDRVNCDNLARTKHINYATIVYRCDEHNRLKSKKVIPLNEMYSDLATHYGIPVEDAQGNAIEPKSKRTTYASGSSGFSETRPTIFAVRPSPQGYRLYGRKGQRGKLEPGLTIAKGCDAPEEKEVYGKKPGGGYGVLGVRTVHPKGAPVPCKTCECGWTAHDASMGSFEDRTDPGPLIMARFSGRNEQQNDHNGNPIPDPRDSSHPRRWEGVEPLAIQWPECGLKKCNNLAVTKHQNAGAAKYRCAEHMKSVNALNVAPMDRIMKDIATHYQIPILRDIHDQNSVVLPADMPRSPQIGKGETTVTVHTRPAQPGHPALTKWPDDPRYLPGSNLEVPPQPERTFRHRDKAKDTVVEGARAGGELRGNAQNRLRRKKFLLNPESGFGAVYKECPRCEGTGRPVFQPIGNEQKCFDCVGTGTLGHVPCYWCGEKLKAWEVEQDRVKPEAGYKTRNIVPACRKCNTGRQWDPLKLSPHSTEITVSYPKNTQEISLDPGDRDIYPFPKTAHELA